MDIAFFDPEKHDYFLEEYSKLSRAPDAEEKEFFEPILEKIILDIADFMDVSSDFKLYFAITKEENLDEDLPINRYVHGFSFPKWMEGFDRDVIMIRAVRDRENWRDCLVNMLAHEIAHQEYYEANKELPETVVENIIFEGLAMNRAERVADALGIEWSPDYRSDEQIVIDFETVVSVLEDERSYDPDDIFQNGEKPCENAEGYNLAYQAVKDIIESTDISLEEVSSLERETMRGEVEKSIRKLSH